MKSTLVMFDAVTPQRMAPDWVVVHPGTGFRLDPTIGTAGSYDSIRHYLWAGMMPAWDPDKARLMSRLRGMRTTLESRPVPPESIDALTGRGEGAGSLGYSAALLPFLASVGAGKALAQQQARLADFRRSPKVYYERALMLFGLGWMDGRYRFERDGHLVVGWGARCTRQ
jgi:endoglucanase